VLEVLADAELRLRDAASKKILLEVTLLRAIEARSALSLDAVLKQLNQLRGPTSNSGTGVVPVQSGAPAQTASRPISFSTAQAATPKPAAPIAPAAVVAAAPVAVPASGDLSELWHQLVEAVGRVSTFTRSYLLNAHPVSFEKNILVIGFDDEFADYLGLVDNARNHTLLTTKLAELGHANAMIKFVKAEAPANWNPKAAAPVSGPKSISTPDAANSPTPAKTAEKIATPGSADKKLAPVAFNKDDFKNDPLIKKALEIFKGTIVEVRA